MQNQDEIQRLNKLSNPELLELAKLAVKDESNATLRVLYILREIQRRRAFAEKHYPSLFEFCVDFLGYKRGAAYRRITALKALVDLPEVEEKIKNGSLRLMTLTQAQTHFTQKSQANSSLSREEKLKLIGELENKSTRQVDEMFLELSPKPAPQEKLKLVDLETYDLRLALPKRVFEKIKLLKSYMGAEKAGAETIEVLEKGLDCAIKDYEKKSSRSVERKRSCESVERRESRESVDRRESRESVDRRESCESVERRESRESVDRRASRESVDRRESRESVEQRESRESVDRRESRESVDRRASCESVERMKSSESVPALEHSTRSIPISVKRKVWKTYQGQCAHVDPETGQRCPSTYRLEIDHVKPKSIGGTNAVENLRLVCRAHNQWAAIQKLGFEKMEPYLS